jgi:hypothetical protein
MVNGVNQKADPYQLSVDTFAELRDVQFQKIGRVDKALGYAQLAQLPTGFTASAVATLAGGLVAIGSGVQGYSAAAGQWVSKGSYTPLALSVVPLVRTSKGQTQCDMAVSPTGLACVTYTDSSGFYYAIFDASTGASVVAQTAIPAGAATVTGNPRVYVLGNYFIIMYAATFSGTARIRYVAIPLTNLTVPGTPTDLTTNFLTTTTGGFAGTVLGSSLYVAWNTTDAGNTVKLGGLTAQLAIYSPTTTGTGNLATFISISGASSGGVTSLFVAFGTATTLKCWVLDGGLNVVTAPTTAATVTAMNNVTVVATSVNSATVCFEQAGVYSYDGSLATDTVGQNTFSRTGTAGTAAPVCRGIGLASQAFLLGTDPVFLAAYAGKYQPSFFLMNVSGRVLARLAYSNGGGYLSAGLPSVSLYGSTYYAPYLYAFAVQAVNKTQGASTLPVQLQSGVNLVGFTTANVVPQAVEIGGALHITGGQLMMYDGTSVVEHGFSVWPESPKVTTSAAGGSITAQTYFYQFCYEWTDGAGFVHRSAPSVPTTIVTSGATSTNTLNVPTLRLTSKTGVRIIAYRWSTAQQTYYALPVVTDNSTTTDSVAITDTYADATILGNTILYTTGNVVEDIGAPSPTALALFKSRLWMISAESPNTLWLSKTVIDGTPVETSNLLTLYVAPTQGTQGSTGPCTALSAIDDKLIIFKPDAAYYVTGDGPDNTGANNDLGQATYITSSVGCTNPRSIALLPNGILFESDKGRWLLDRGLSTQYSGAFVEAYNSYTCSSALTVPGTNEVRLTLQGGPTLVYDYFFDKWMTRTAPATILGACLYQGKHTYLTASVTSIPPSGVSTVTPGFVWQEAAGTYVNGSRPVLMAVETGWLNMAGLQGLERVRQMFLLGTYLSPHKLTVSVYYDYNPTPSQVTVITPDNYASVYGSDVVYGGGTVYGGNLTLEQWRVFMSQQKCQAVKVRIEESYDSSYGVAPGAGLTLSGLSFKAAVKSQGDAKLPAVRSKG